MYVRGIVLFKIVLRGWAAIKRCCQRFYPIQTIERCALLNLVFISKGESASSLILWYVVVVVVLEAKYFFT